MPVRSLRDLPSPPEGRAGWPWDQEPAAFPERMPDGGVWPRFTIVTPSYNQGAFLEKTLRSVLLQGYPALEYFVMDGGSTDESRAILERYGHLLTDWASEPDGGQSHAINKGLDRGSGEVFGWLNSDDYLLPGALRHLAETVRAHPHALAWVGGCLRIDAASGREIDVIVPRGLDADDIADWGGRGFFYQPSCYFSASAWRDGGRMDEDLHLAMDLDLWIRLARAGRFVSTGEVLAAATRHESMKTQADRGRMHAETAIVQIRHGYVEAATARLETLLARRVANRSGRDRVSRRARRVLRTLGKRFGLGRRLPEGPAT